MVRSPGAEARGSLAKEAWGIRCAAGAGGGVLASTARRSRWAETGRGWNGSGGASAAVSSSRASWPCPVQSRRGEAIGLSIPPNSAPTLTPAAGMPELLRSVAGILVPRVVSLRAGTLAPLLRRRPRLPIRHQSYKTWKEVCSPPGTRAAAALTAWRAIRLVNLNAGPIA